MPDAANWGDAGSDTLGNILKSRKVNLPNLQKLGLGNIRPLQICPHSKIRRKLRQMHSEIKRQRHNNRTLGNGGHHFEKGFSDFSTGFSTADNFRIYRKSKSPRRSRQMSRQAARKSSNNSAKNISERANRLFILPPIPSFKSPRTKKLSRSKDFMKSATSREKFSTAKIKSGASLRDLFWANRRQFQTHRKPPRLRRSATVAIIFCLC